MVYCVCGVLRLVRFNVSSIEAKDDPELVAAGKKISLGCRFQPQRRQSSRPTFFLASEEWHALATISDEMRAWILFCVLIVIGYFMISRWKFPSLKTLHIRVASFQIVFLTVVVAVFYFLRHSESLPGRVLDPFLGIRSYSLDFVPDQSDHRPQF